MASISYVLAVVPGFGEYGVRWGIIIGAILGGVIGFIWVRLSIGRLMRYA